MSNADWFHSLPEEDDALEKCLDHDFKALVKLPLPVMVKVLDRLQEHYMRIGGVV